MITLPMRFYNLIKFVLMLVLLVSLLVLLLFVSARIVSAAGPWYVSTTGNNSNDCLSWATACRTIQGAVNKATSGDTIYISAGTFVENVYTSKSLTFIGQGADFTIVDGDDNDSVFYIDYANASFSNLTIQNGYGFIGGGGIYADGTLNLEYVNVLSNTGGWGGGGIYAGAAATLTGGRFQNNTAYNRSGGGVYANSTLTLSGTQFIGNRAPLDFAGGGIYANGAVELINGHFENNISGYTGGGLYTDSTLTINNTQFISNTAVSDGCGAYTSSSAILTGSRFESNSCTDFCKGGGLYVDGNLTLTGTQFISNTATYGGGAYVEHTATLTNGYFENNRSSQWGGGLLVWDAWAPLTLNETLFINNSASAGGGAWAMGEITLIGGRFDNNQGTDSGGGLFVNNSLILTGTQFFSNTAGNNGGAVYLPSSSGNGRLVNTMLARNTAGSTGEAIFSGNTVQVIHSTIASPTIGTGPAIFVYDTTYLTNTLISSYTVGVQSNYTIYEDYNLFYSVSTPFNGTVNSGGHTLTDNPAFLNPAADDYHLTPGSMAVDNGIDAGVYTDLDGEPRPQGSGYDIGAYELDDSIPLVVVTSSSNPAMLGQTVTFTATVTSGAGTPTGNVTFFIDGASQSPVTLVNGEATFSTASLTLGNHTVAANYSGDTNFDPSSGSLPGGQTILASSITTVASSLNPSTFGQTVTFTATVTSGAGTPTGNVTFIIDGISQSPVTLVNGQATFTTASLAVGNHPVSANYIGDANFNSSSGSLIGGQTVNNSIPANQAPYTPSNPIPTNASNNIPITQTLSWYGGDPDGDVVTYTIAFWTSDTPPTVETTNLTSYTPSLISGTTYYWVITATDGISESVGPLWNFATEVTAAGDTEFVYLPIILTGPSSMTTITPQVAGHTHLFPELGSSWADSDSGVQSNYFKTTANNREFRRGLFEFNLPEFEDSIVRATLIYSHDGGPFSNTPQPTIVHELSYYQPADLIINTADHNRPTTFLATIESDWNWEEIAFSIDITNLVRQYEGETLGFRIKLADDPTYSEIGDFGWAFGILNNAYLPPQIVIYTR